MKKTLMTLGVLSLIISAVFAATVSPKREFRAVWLSTVTNIDWPKSKYDSDLKKQNDLKAYLEKMKDTGLNAVLMQVRCSCDAMYDSPYEPWSYWFSGKQGTGPSTDWDPLAYAVEEAHKLGLEMHAWVNPYRAVVSPSMVNNTDYISSQHVTQQHPDWILKFSSVYILDPGLPQVRDYITDVLMDIVNRYDVDGLHMDDYFYPYEGITDEDSATFANYSRGFENINDWRRDNINLLVESIMDSINAVKPWVKWGISPFGIYKPGVPSGITGMNAWSVLYCDPIAWLAAGTVDYITPQCYWQFGGGQDYGKLIPWWAEQAQYYKKHFYPGQALYRASDFPRGEIPRQIRLNRETENCDGSVFFTANDFYDNILNTVDSMTMDLYKYPALWPVMAWKDSTAPAAPQNPLLAVNGDGSKTLTWEAPGYTDPSDSAYAYVIYRAPYRLSDDPAMDAALEIQMNQSRTLTDATEGMFYYAVTSLDRYKQESTIAELNRPFVDPLFPPYAESSITKDPNLIWSSKESAAQYELEVSTSADFTDLVADYTQTDTIRNLALDYQTDYFWRIKSDNTTYWSPVWTFTTELPPQVQLSSPFAYYEGTTITPDITWHSFEDADSYLLTVARDAEMSDIVVQETALSDTSYQANGLDYASYYYWQVRSNKYDRWSEIQSFKTKEEFIDRNWEQSSLMKTYPAFLDTGLTASGLAVGEYNGNQVLLVLQSSEDSISVSALDPATGEPVSFELNLDGVDGGLYALRDIEMTSDGVIYASNCVNSGGSFKIYQWLVPTQAPVCVYQADDVAFRLGDHLTVTGEYQDGSIAIYAIASSHYKFIKLNWNQVSSSFEAEQLSLDRTNKTIASIAFIPGQEDYYVNSTGYGIRKFSSANRMTDLMDNSDIVSIKANSLCGFTYNNKLYLATYACTNESAFILDVTDGLSTALSAGATYRLGMNANSGTNGDIEVADLGDGTFKIFVLGNQNGLGSYTFDAASAMVDVAETDVADHFELKQNYPNPFNPVTMIPYSLNFDAKVKIDIFDLRGHKMETLFNGYQFAGEHEVRFNASHFSSGVYICRMTADQEVATIKLTLMK